MPNVNLRSPVTGSAIRAGSWARQISPGLMVLIPTMPFIQLSIGKATYARWRLSGAQDGTLIVP